MAHYCQSGSLVAGLWLGTQREYSLPVETGKFWTESLNQLVERCSVRIPLEGIVSSRHN
jgi:hypothetical protein